MSKKQQIKLDMEQWTGSKLGKEYIKAAYRHPTYLTYMHIMHCAGLDEAQAGIKTVDFKEKYQQPQICRWYHSNSKKWRVSKETLDEGETGEWKSRLKTEHSKNEDHGVWSYHFMVNRWRKNAVTDFIFLGPKITGDSDCTHEIKRCFLLRRKAIINLDSILKSRDITLPTNICIVKTLVSPVVMYKWESWTTKKAEHRRIDVFKLWCWKRLLRAPWIAKRWHQSILKEINPEYSLEGLMLKLELQYFGHQMWWANSLEKILMLEKIEGRRRRQQKLRRLDGITDSMDMILNKFCETVKDREAWLAAVHGVVKSQKWLSD